MKASAIANTNIALIKYWGKRDKKLFLPYNSSISVTLEGLFSHTTVEFDKKYRSDIFILNGKELKFGNEYNEVVSHLEMIRQVAGISEKAKVVSMNNFPTAAGLASSASGLAALTLASTAAAGLDLDKKQLSILARRGSGSASRSIEGGFVEWQKGKRADGMDSYAIQLAPPQHWPEFRMVITITSKKEKKIKSRAGMAQTVATSPMYKTWLETIEDDLKKMRRAIKEKDFQLLGQTAEANCLKMHATMITTRPAIIYWNAGTMTVVHSVMEWREQGIESYFTIDAGPQVKIICLEKNVGEIVKRLRDLPGIEDVIVTRPGGPAKLTKKHLF
ncbi:MAG: diphosphomevalonate decarboxylase [Candidatus Aenigmatarchaeota archaeon]